jgi:hypothetical protein
MLVQININVGKSVALGNLYWAIITIIFQTISNFKSEIDLDSSVISFNLSKLSNILEIAFKASNELIRFY